MKTYEGLFILPNSLDDEGVEKVVQRIQEEITRAGGTVSNRENLGRRGFARRMNKQSGGSYIRLRFDLDPGAMAAFKPRLKIVEGLFRSQVVVAPTMAMPVAPVAEAQRDG